MISRLAFAVVALAGIAAGQIQLFLHEARGSEKPLGATLEFGSVPFGDYRDIPLRIRNVGESSVTLTRFRIRGAGFTLEGHPSIPHVVAPGLNVDFRVRFRPTGFGTFSAVLEINELSVFLLGESPPTAVLAIEEEGRLVALASGQTVVFGRIQRGEKLERRFHLVGPAEASVSVFVRSLSLGPGVFEASELPSLPLELAPGRSVSFTITYAPARAGIHQATLQVDDRRFVLEGVAYDPPLPKPEIRLEQPAYRSGQQGKLSIALASPSPATGTGELQIEFQSAVQPAGDDPAILFVNGGGRSLRFSVAEGETAARFGSEAFALFQTGTTAGTITFVARLGGYTVRSSITIAAAPVVLDSGAGRRSAGGVEVEIRGFDNSRTVSEVAFTFFDTSGRLLPGQPIRSQVADLFRNYFQTSAAGGLFSLTASFPVTGDASLLGAVEVQFTSAPGTSEKLRIVF
jgi:hypothetical protein